MKINCDYLKQLLETFASSDKVVIDYNDLKSATLINDANTFFHLLQVEDEGCIERADSHLFITLLAYQLVQLIRRRLKESGINANCPLANIT